MAWTTLQQPVTTFEIGYGSWQSPGGSRIEYLEKSPRAPKGYIGLRFGGCNNGVTNWNANALEKLADFCLALAKQMRNKQ